MAKSNAKYNIFAFEIVASLIFFGIILGFPGLATNSFAEIWLPLLYGAAIIGSICLFLISFGTLMSKDNSTFVREGFYATAVTGFSLVILTYGTSIAFIAAIFGFIIGLIGLHLKYARQ